MKTINSVATLCMSIGLATFAGSFLFGAGSLTVLGWVCMLPLFVGSTGHVALSIYNLVPDAKEKPAADVTNEAAGKKPATANA